MLLFNVENFDYSIEELKSLQTIEYVINEFEKCYGEMSASDKVDNGVEVIVSEIRKFYEKLRAKILAMNDKMWKEQLPLSLGYAIVNRFSDSEESTGDNRGVKFKKMLEDLFDKLLEVIKDKMNLNELAETPKNVEKDRTGNNDDVEAQLKHAYDDLKTGGNANLKYSLEVEYEEEEILMLKIISLQFVRVLVNLETFLTFNCGPENILAINHLLKMAYDIFQLKPDTSNIYFSMENGRDKEPLDPIDVIEFIHKEMEDSEQSFNDLKNKALSNFQTDSGDYDFNVVVEKAFIEKALELWFLSCMEIMEELNNVKTITRLREIFTMLKGIESIRDANEKFTLIGKKNMKYFASIEPHLNDLISNEMEQECLRKLRNGNLDIIYNAFSLRIEIKFIKKLREALINSYNRLDEFIDSFQLNELVENSISMSDLLNAIELCELRNIYELKKIASELKEFPEYYLESILKQDVAEIIKPPEIKMITANNEIHLQVICHILILNTLKPEIEKYLKENPKIELVIFDGEILYVDDDLDKKIWHGKNISISVKTIKVVSHINWNVSGLDGSQESTKAGHDESGNGIAADDGSPGESGGNIKITAGNIFYDPDAIWKISSNGGNGGRGQDGGDGHDGENGVNANENDMHQWWGHRDVKMRASAEHKKPRDVEIVHYQKNYVAPHWFGDYVHFKRYNKNYHYYRHEKILYWRRLHLCIGSDGTPGHAGGEKGVGGEPGSYGTIEVITIEKETSRLVTETNQGIFGQNGLGGYNGLNGITGGDYGWFDFNSGAFWKNMVKRYNEPNTKYEIRVLSNKNEDKHHIKDTTTNNDMHIAKKFVLPFSRERTRNDTKVTRERQNHAKAKPQSAITNISKSRDKSSNKFDEISQLINEIEKAQKEESKEKSQLSAEIKMIRAKRDEDQLDDVPPSEIKKGTMVSILKAIRSGESNKEITDEIRKTELTSAECTEILGNFNDDNGQKQLSANFEPSTDNNQNELIKEIKHFMLSQHFKDEEINNLRRRAEDFMTNRTTTLNALSNLIKQSLKLTDKSLLNKFVSSENNVKAQETFTTYSDRFFSVLHQKYIAHLKADFNWIECLQYSSFQEEFKDHMLNQYPFFYYFYILGGYRKGADVTQNDINNLLHDKKACADLAYLNSSLVSIEKVEIKHSMDDKLPGIYFLPKLELFTSAITDSSFGNLEQYITIDSKLLRNNISLYLENYWNDLNFQMNLMDEKTKDRIMSTYKNKNLGSDFDFTFQEKSRSNEILNEFIDKIKWRLIQKDTFEFSEKIKFKRQVLAEINDCGVRSKVYRQLLSKAFNINLRIYTSNLKGDLAVVENHNEGYGRTAVNVLVTSEAFYSLVNENLLFKNQKRAKVAFSCDEKIRAFMKTSRSCAQSNLSLNCMLDTSFYIDNLLGTFKHFTNQQKLRITSLLQSISMENFETNAVLEAIFRRVFNDGINLHYEDLNVILSMVFKFIINDNNMLNILEYQLLAYPQTEWMTEIALLEMEEKLYLLSDNLKEKWRRKLNELQYPQFRTVFVKKLLEYNGEPSEQFFDEILIVMHDFSLKSYQNFGDLGLENWKYEIGEEYWREQLKNLNQDEELARETHELAIFYLSELQTTLSHQNVKNLIDILMCEKEKLKTFSLIKILINFYNNEWSLSADSFKIFKEYQAEEWVEKMNIEFGKRDSEKQRSIQQIIMYAERNQETSNEIKSHLKEAEKVLTGFTNMVCGRFGKKFSDFGLSDLTSWRPTSSNSSDRIETLAVIARAFELKINVTLRMTQLFTILEFIWSTEKGLLAQVSTGEGKSFIGVAFACCQVLHGKKVDIITSSSLLAKRDAEDTEANEIFKTFGITVAHNCSEHLEERRNAYKSNVVYGSLSNFQRDHLLDQFYKQNIHPTRGFSCVIIDEVDSMLLDKGNNILYLSHDLPEMDDIESVFVFIWKEINKPAASEAMLVQSMDRTIIRDKVLSAMIGKISVEFIADLFEIRNDSLAKNIWENMRKKEFIDEEGFVRREKVNILELFAITTNECPQDVLRKLEFYFKHNANNRSFIRVPHHLKDFVILHLDNWIESAIKAFCMPLKVDYVIDRDRVGSIQDFDPNIIIMDIDTGTDQENSQWDEALHQFLQLKHGCKLTPISLKSVFISNVSYFKLYGNNVYGMTGTLGTHLERDKLAEIHKVRFLTVPTFKPKKFIEMQPIVALDSPSWTRKIVEEVQVESKMRAVLVICKTIAQLDQVNRELRNVIPINKLIVHQRDSEHSKQNEYKKLDSGYVVLSTNLAGRGTNIKLKDSVIKANGLHVVLTYLPTNVRIEQQAFGRSARQGEPGSGRLIINSNETTNIILLKRMRNSNEFKRLTEIIKFYNNVITVEEELFNTFKRDFSNVTEENERKKILRENFLNEWTFWLDRNAKKLNSNDKSCSKQLKDLLRNFLAEANSSLHIQPTTNIKLAIMNTQSVSSNYASALHHLTLVDNQRMNSALFSYFKYYVRASIQTQINKCLSRGHERKLLFKSLFQFQELKDQYDLREILISPIIEKFRESRLEKQGFANQTENFRDIYDAYIDSIYNLIGYTVIPKIFEDILSNPSSSEELFNELLASDVLTKYKISNDIDDEQLNMISLKFMIPPESIRNYCEMNRTKQFNSIIDIAKNLEKVIDLPSLEEFWEILVKENILTNVVRYLIIDKKILSDIDPSLLDILEKETSKSTKDRLQSQRLEQKTMADVFIQQIESINDEFKEKKVFIIQNAHMVKRFGEEIISSLVRRGALTYNIQAKFMNNALRDPKKFNRINVNDFTAFGIDNNAANQILMILEENKFITKLRGSPDAYTLKDSYKKFHLIDFKSNRIYQILVSKIMTRCFAYQIAYQKLYESVSLLTHNFKSTRIIKKKGIEVDLSGKYSLIHLENASIGLACDLVSSFIITPNRVNMALGEASRAELIRYIVRNDFTRLEFFKIFQLNYGMETSDASQNKLIRELLDQDLIVINPSGKYSIVHDIANKHFNSKNFTSIERSIHLLLKTRRKLHDESAKIIERVANCRSLLADHEVSCAFLRTVPLEQILPRLKDTEELRTLQTKGYNFVIQLEKRNWLTGVYGAFLLALWGLLKVLVGTIITIVTIGKLHVSKELISKGIDDINIAHQGYRSGYLSWNDYAKHRRENVIRMAIVESMESSMIYNMFGNFLMSNFPVLEPIMRKLSESSEYVVEAFKKGEDMLLKMILKEVSIKNRSARVRNVGITIAARQASDLVDVTSNVLISDGMEKIYEELESTQFQDKLKYYIESLGGNDAFAALENVLKNLADYDRSFNLTTDAIADNAYELLKSEKELSTIANPSFVQSTELYRGFQDQLEQIMTNIKSELDTKITAAQKEASKKSTQKTSTNVQKEVLDEITKMMKDKFRKTFEMLHEFKISTPLKENINRKLQHLIPEQTAKSLYGVYRFQPRRSLLANNDKIMARLKPKHIKKITELDISNYIMQQTKSPSLKAKLFEDMSFVEYDEICIEAVRNVLKKDFGKGKWPKLVIQRGETLYEFFDENVKEEATNLIIYNGNRSDDPNNDNFYDSLIEEFPVIKSKMNAKDFRQKVAEEIRNNEHLHRMIAEQPSKANIYKCNNYSLKTI